MWIIKEYYAVSTTLALTEVEAEALPEPTFLDPDAADALDALDAEEADFDPLALDPDAFEPLALEPDPAAISNFEAADLEPEALAEALDADAAVPVADALLPDALPAETDPLATAK